MKALFVVFIALILSSIPRAANAVDTTIKILGVALEDSDVDLTWAAFYLGQMPVNWSGSSGTTVQLANGGAIISLQSPITSGLSLIQLEAAKQSAITLGLRETYEADLIVFFTGQFASSSTCGVAPQYDWISDGTSTPSFIPSGPNGLDLRGADDIPGHIGSYAAIIATNNTACIPDHPNVGVHELGHLFGAGHSLYLSSAGTYLFPDSHAEIGFDWSTYQIYKTLMGG